MPATFQYSSVFWRKISPTSPAAAIADTQARPNDTSSGLARVSQRLSSVENSSRGIASGTISCEMDSQLSLCPRQGPFAQAMPAA